MWSLTLTTPVLFIITLESSLFTLWWSLYIFITCYLSFLSTEFSLSFVLFHLTSTFTENAEILPAPCLCVTLESTHLFPICHFRAILIIPCLQTAEWKHKISAHPDHPQIMQHNKSYEGGMDRRTGSLGILGLHFNDCASVLSGLSTSVCWHDRSCGSHTPVFIHHFPSPSSHHCQNISSTSKFPSVLHTT